MTDVGDLSGRTSRGAAITLAWEVIVKGLAVVAIAVVARVLDAGAYGPVVLAMAVFGFADILSNPALRTTLLREPQLQDLTIDTAWSLSVVRGLLLTVAFWLVAPWLATLWPEQRAVMADYLRLLACSFALTGMQNLHLVRLRRSMHFARALLVESVAPICTSLAAIAALLWTHEAVWLVAAQPIGAGAGAVASLLLVVPRPRFRLGAGEVRRLWAFGRPLMLNGAMGYVLLAGDDVFVEYLAGAVALGAYSMSYRWSHVAVKFVAHGLQGVLTPAYVLIREDLARTRHIVASSLSVLTALCGIVAGLFVAFSTEFFHFIGGERWPGASSVAKALVPFVISHGMNACLTPVFIVHGRPGWLTRVIALQLLAFFPAMYIGFTLLGLSGLAWGISVLGMGVTAALAWLAHRLIGMRPGMFIAASLPPLSIAACSALLGWIAVRGVADDELRLFVGGGAAVMAFVVTWESLCRSPLGTRLPVRSFFTMAEMLRR